MDLRERLVVFLAYPGDPETPELPAAFAVRALNPLLIRSLLVTAIKNPVTLLSRGFWHLGTSRASPPSPPGRTAPAARPRRWPPARMDLAAWEKDLDRITSVRRYQGKIELLIDGEQFFPALIQSVEGAARSVDVQVFIFDNDEYAVKIADLLKKRSRRSRSGS